MLGNCIMRGCSHVQRRCTRTTVAPLVSPMVRKGTKGRTMRNLSTHCALFVLIVVDITLMSHLTIAASMVVMVVLMASPMTGRVMMTMGPSSRYAAWAVWLCHRTTGDIDFGLHRWPCRDVLLC